MAAAVLNPESFRRAVLGVIEQAIKNGRGDDLDRVVSHVESQTTPQEVSRLAALMYLLDEEYVLPLQEATAALRKFYERRGESVEDDAILAIMREAYQDARQRG